MPYTFVATVTCKIKLKFLKIQDEKKHLQIFHIISLKQKWEISDFSFEINFCFMYVKNIDILKGTVYNFKRIVKKKYFSFDL